MRPRPVFMVAAVIVGLTAWHSAPLAPQRYRVEFKASQVIDLTALGQGEQRNSTNMTAFIQVALADTAGGQLVDITLDSVRADSSPVPQATYDSLRGMSWHGVRDTKGRVTSWTSSSENPLVGQLGASFRYLFPRVPQGTKPGVQWTDTLETTDDLPGGSLTSRAVTNYQSTAEKFEGRDALKVQSASSSSFSGTQQGGGGPVNLEGTGSSTGTHFIAPRDGVYYSGMTTSTQSLLASGSFSPEPIPVTITVETRTTLLK